MKKKRLLKNVSLFLAFVLTTATIPVYSAMADSSGIPFSGSLGAALWSTGTSGVQQSGTAMMLTPGAVMDAGDSIAINADCFLAMQGDGNLVLYENGQVKWALGYYATPVAGSFATMQGDGNFVVYTQSGTPVWATMTNGNPGAFLVFQLDSNVVIYSPPSASAYNGKIVALQAESDGKYVSAPNMGANSLTANQSYIGPTEEFYEVEMGNGQYAFQALANNKYVCAESAGADALIANRASAGLWETFAVTENSDGAVSLQSQANGEYVTAAGAGTALIADSTTVGTPQLFKLVTVSDFSQTAEFEKGALGGNSVPGIHSGYTGYTGTGFVDYFNTDGQSVTVSINAPYAGKYNLKFRYTATGLSASKQILVNGVSIEDNYVFPSTSSWSNWQVVTIQADLNAGTNTIEVLHNTSLGSNDYVNLDNMTADNLVSSVSFYSIIQAEDSTLGGSYLPVIIQSRSFYGTGIVTAFYSDGQYVSFHVTVPAAGTYYLRFRYSTTGCARQILVNGTALNNACRFPSTQNAPADNGNYYSVTSEMSTSLNQGSNTITVKYSAANGSEGSLDLDELRVSSIATPAVTPSVAPPSLSSSDVIVYDDTVTQFGAVAGSPLDQTAAFQAAIDAVDAQGGGTVYVPAGKYRINGTLRLCYGVTLRGEWENPDSGGLGQGTILCAYGENNNPTGNQLIDTYASSTVRDLSIWYPMQNYISVSQFPYSIDGHHSEGTQGNNVVMDVTFYNSYCGIRMNYTHGCTSLRNIYGTILNTGVYEDKGYDIGRYENIFFDTSYWAGSGLPGAPSGSSRATLNSYTQANTTGIDEWENDWGYMYNLHFSNMLTGLQFDDANCAVSRVTTASVNTGIKIARIAYPGLQVTDSDLNASVGTNPVCLSYSAFNTTHNTCGNEVVSVSNTTFGGQPATCILMNGTQNPVLNLTSCTFEDWGYGSGTYAVDVEKGALVAMKCTFQQNKMDIKLASAISAANILNNTFNTGAQIDNYKGSNVNISSDAITMPAMPAYSYTFAPVYKPANTSNFYNVRLAPYSAAADGVTDDTAAIQSALTAAGNAGGGTVYVPAGIYRIDGSLTIPSGVELRGSYNGTHSATILSGTQFYVYGGRGNADGTPLISLSTSSSLRGVTVFYPEQGYSTSTITPYPWTVRGLGGYCSVTGLSMVNAYNGIDMKTNSCSNSVIADVQSFALHTQVQVGNGVTGGWLQDVHFNPCNWTQSGYVNAPSDTDSADVLYDYCLANTTGFGLGSCSNYYNFQNFTILIKNPVLMESDSYGSYSGTIYGFAFDANCVGVDVQQAGTVNFINPMDVSMCDGGGPNIKTESTFTGTINYFNGDSWGPGTQVCNVNGGTLNLVQYFSWCCPDAAANNGTLNIYGSEFVHQPSASPDCVFSSGITAGSIIGCIGYGGLSITDNSGGKLTQSYNLSY